MKSREKKSINNGIDLFHRLPIRVVRNWGEKGDEGRT